LAGGRGNSTAGRIVFVSDRSGFDELYTMEPDGSDVLRLTSDGAENRGPAWSPDRTQIAFWHYTEETEGDVYLVDADGGGEHPITSGPERDAYPAWSPDGTKIAFSRDFQIHVMNADGSHVEKLTAIREGADFPAWSPDGKQIAFVGDLGARQSLYVMNLDGSGLTRIYRETQLETGEYLTAGSWSPDGDWILFTRIDTSIGKCSQDDLFRIHPDGTGLTRVTRTRNSAADSWSPGGEKILVERTFGDSCTVEMFTMNTDGTGRTQITSGPANNFGGNWGPPSS
jgi:TolB protein